MSKDDTYPAVKQLGPALVGVLDTTANEARRHAQGRFPLREVRWVFAQMKRWRGPRLLLMHHWPFEWSVTDVDEEIAALSTAKRVLLRAVQGALGLDDDDLQQFADVNFCNLPKVQNALRGAPLDTVLCGHLHSWDGARARAFDRKLGKVRVHCMGRSGGIHQGSQAEHAFHLVDLGPNKVKVKTVFVRRNSLGS